MLDALHRYSAEHIDENLESVPVGNRENELFFNCTFRDVRGATLKRCNLHHSKFLTDRIEDALGFTVTLDCNSFQDVELSPLLFDLLLCLLLKTKGNTEKRRKLLDVIGRDNAHKILSEMARIES